MIVLKHGFNGVIGATYEDVRLIDTLCGSDGVVLSTVSGHHAGSEKRGGHCASAPVIVTKVSTAAGAGIHCPALIYEDSPKIRLTSCRPLSQQVAAAFNVVEAQEVAIWQLSGSVPRQDECFIPCSIEMKPSSM